MAKILVLVLILVLTSDVLAQTLQRVCTARDNIVELLSNDYGEALVGLGLSATGNIVELWTSQYGETFSVLVTNSSGISCVVGHGEHWTNIGNDQWISPGKKAFNTH